MGKQGYGMLPRLYVGTDSLLRGIIVDDNLVCIAIQ